MWSNVETESLKCPVCKSENLEIIDKNIMFITVKCNECNKIVDMFTNVEQKPIKKAKSLGFEDITDKD